ncbi:MAG: hypothetical protein N2544_07015 [Burkholderiales bacterium]|nr:hypothetical protein [Burkholderiales bacterium]
MAGERGSKDGLPKLFDSQEIEVQRAARSGAEQPAAAGAPHPFPIVQAKFPRIALQIHDLWGTPECDRYLDKLIIDDRGNRTGFPPDVMTALLELSRQHQRQFGFVRAENEWVDDPLSRNRSR